AFLGDLGDIADGPHTVAVRAQDGAGLTAERVHTITVDRTPPAILITGVQDGETYAEPVTIEIAVDDANPDELSATLDGEPFTSGDTVDAAGDRVLEVDAIDAAGNESSERLTFEISLDATSPTVVRVSGGDLGIEEISECRTLQESVTRLEIEFSEPLPAALSDPENLPIRLKRPGANRVFDETSCSVDPGTSDDLSIALVGTELSPSRIELAVSGRLADEAYQLRICGDLEDAAGNALDGDGDGVGGDDYLLYFRVDRMNQLANGHFDCGASGWTLEPEGSAQISQSAEDFEDAPHSGSLQFALSGSQESFGLAQCADLRLPSLEYSFEMRLRLDGDEDRQAAVTPECEFYGEPACLGESLGGLTLNLVLRSTEGLWTDLIRPLDLPPAALSALCAVRVQSIEEEPLEVFLDRVFLGPAEQAVFLDNFEDGTVNRWSSAVGLEGETP
ncbi:MAG: hypothetical protein AAF725_18905, partial [Acidobacteriota bacterium]